VKGKTGGIFWRGKKQSRTEEAAVEGTRSRKRRKQALHEYTNDATPTLNWRFRLRDTTILVGRNVDDSMQFQASEWEMP
jgi:hypothetical protein